MSHRKLHSGLGATARALRTSKNGIPIHAGACDFGNGDGLLIAGPSGSGKSTLTLALALRRRAQVVSDDTVWLDGGTAHGLGAPVAIRAGSPLWAELQQLWYAEPGERMLVLPSDLHAPPMVLAAELNAIVFPRLDAGGSRVSPLGPAETLCRMIESVLRPCSAAEVLELGALASRCTAAEITYGDLDDSLCQIDAFMVAEPAMRPMAVLMTDEELFESGLDTQVGGLRFGDDVVLWNQPAASMICLAGWPAGATLAAGDARDQLARLGFFPHVDRKR